MSAEERCASCQWAEFSTLFGLLHHLFHPLLTRTSLLRSPLPVEPPGLESSEFPEPTGVAPLYTRASGVLTVDILETKMLACEVCAMRGLSKYEYHDRICIAKKMLSRDEKE